MYNDVDSNNISSEHDIKASNMYLFLKDIKLLAKNDFANKIIYGTVYGVNKNIIAMMEASKTR